MSEGIYRGDRPHIGIEMGRTAFSIATKHPRSHTMMDGHPINIVVEVSYSHRDDSKANGGALIDEAYTLTSTDSVYSASDALRRMADDLDKAERLPPRLTPLFDIE